jgi:hypothetical protein
LLVTGLAVLLASTRGRNPASFQLRRHSLV